MALLAKKLRIGRNVALYRIQRLKEKGILKGSFAEINNPALGYYSFRIFLRLGNFTPTQKQELFEFIKKNKRVIWFSQVIGKWDLDLIFMTKSLSEFDTLRRELFFRHNQIIEDSDIALLTQMYYYPKDYLLNQTRKEIQPTILDVGMQKTGEIDSKDEALLHYLTRDATMSIVELASKLRLSINTVKKRIKNLEKNKIILGYRLFIDTDKLGYQHYKTHIALRNYTEKDVKAIRDWLARKSFVVYLDHYINGEDFEIELHLKSESEYIAFIDELNKEFGQIIKEQFMIRFHDVQVFKYLPDPA